MASEFEQQLQTLLKVEDAPTITGELQVRKVKICEETNRLVEEFNGRLLEWANSYSDRWKQVQQVLIRASYSLNIRNQNLGWFVERVKNGLVPLGEKPNLLHPENNIYFDFAWGQLVTIPVLGDGAVERREKFVFDAACLTRRDDLQGFVSDQDKFAFDNLIPGNFLRRFTFCLQYENKSF